MNFSLIFLLFLLQIPLNWSNFAPRSENVVLLDDPWPGSWLYRPWLYQHYKPSTGYDDLLVRSKFVPMAAAAKGTKGNIEECLARSFNNAQLYRLVKVNCQQIHGQICSGFTALAHSDKAIILSFRGTNSLSQFLIEINQTLGTNETISPFGIGKVGSYFADIFNELKGEGIINDTLYLARSFPNYELWITGHSLGASLASLAAAELSSKHGIPGNRVKLVTFGQPRTGDELWAKEMDKAFPSYNFRVVHAKDIVPHLPPGCFHDYHHYKTEIWYNNSMAPSSPFYVCTGADEDPKCSKSLHRCRIQDHLIYFGVDFTKYGKTGCKQPRFGLKRKKIVEEEALFCL